MNLRYGQTNRFMTALKYNRYTSRSPKVSDIGLGCWQLGENSGWQSMSEKQAINMVRTSIDLGVNFFDTAPNYGLGTSEIRIGKALNGLDRGKLVINTKFGHSVSGELNFDPASIRSSLEGSLKRLQVDYIDSLIIHNPPVSYLNGNEAPHYEILEQLVEEGKILAYGASVDSYDEMKLLMDTTNSEVIEVFFNILHQDTARGFEQALKKKIAIIAKIPLDSGWLSGKYKSNSTFEDIRSRWSKSDIKTRSKLIQKLKHIIGMDQDLAQVALSFCLAFKAVSTVIPGNTNVAQLKNNLKSSEKWISKELVKKLESFYQNEVKQLELPW